MGVIAVGIAMGKGSGAVPRFQVPKVWSPAGGWWCKPTNWKKNTATCAPAIIPVTFYLFAQSVNKEKRYHAGNPMPYVRIFGRGENPQPTPGSARSVVSWRRVLLPILDDLLIGAVLAMTATVSC